MPGCWTLAQMFPLPWSNPISTVHLFSPSSNSRSLAGNHLLQEDFPWVQVALDRCPSPSCPSSTTPAKSVMWCVHCLFPSSCWSSICCWTALSNSSLCWRELVAAVFEVHWIIVSHRKWPLIQNCYMWHLILISFPILSSSSPSSSFITHNDHWKILSTSD